MISDKGEDKGVSSDRKRRGLGGRGEGRGGAGRLETEEHAVFSGVEIRKNTCFTSSRSYS